MATITWIPSSTTSGTLWTDPANWAGGVVPGAGDTAVFPVETSTTYEFPTIDTGSTVAIGSVIAAPGAIPELVVRGTLDVSGTLALAGGGGQGTGDIVGGTVDVTGGAEFSNTLDGVTVIGTPGVNRYFGAGAITGGLTVLSPVLELISPLNFVGSQTLHAVELDTMGFTIVGTLTVAAGTLVRSDPAYQTSGYTFGFGNGTVVNDGTIATYGRSELAGSIENGGLISFLGTYDTIGAGSLTNAGTIVVGGTEDLNFAPQTGQTIANAGLISVTAGGTLSIGGTLENTGGTIALAAGASVIFSQYYSAETVEGGTVVGMGGMIAHSLGLDNVSLAGSFAGLDGLASGTTGFVSLTPGVRAAATITLGLTYQADAAVNDVDLTLLYGHQAVTLSSAGALTLGPSSDIAFAGTAPALSFPWTVTGGTSLVLGGTVEAVAGYVYLGAGSGGVVNTGTINTMAGETLSIRPANFGLSPMSFSNHGVLQLAPGSVLLIGPSVTVPVAGFAGLTQSGATLDLGGTVDGSATPGGTITFAAGSFVNLGGLIRDVAVADNTAVTVGGTLDGVTWQGLPLDVSNQALTVVKNGLSVQGAAGAPGTIVIGGTNSILNFQTDTTLDNVNVMIGSTLAAPGFDTFSLVDGTNPTQTGASNLLIGTHASVTVAGSETYNGFNNINTLTVAGTISFGLGGSAAAPSLATGGSGATFSEQSAGTSINPLPVNLEVMGILGLSNLNDIYGDGNIGDEIIAKNQDTLDTSQVQETGATLDSFRSINNSSKDLAVQSGSAKTVSTAAVLPPTELTSANETTIDGTGTIFVGNQSVFGLNAIIGSDQTLAFEPSSGIFALFDPVNVKAKIVGFGAGDAIDLGYEGYTGGTATYSNGQLSVPTATGTFALNVQFAAGYSVTNVSLIDDTQGGTMAVIKAAATTPPSLPDVSASFTAATEANLAEILSAMTPAGTTPNAVSVAGGGSAGAPLGGTLNAYVVTVAGSGSDTVPAGFAAGYVLGAATTLQDINGNTVLIGAGTGGALIGAANDTLFGGNAAGSLAATAGAETLVGGTGGDLFQLGSGADSVSGQGADTIVGGTGSATIGATGAPLVFLGGGSTLFNAAGSAATLIGGAGSATINAGAANILQFAGPGGFAFNAGSGASTVVGGTGGATITGGSTGMLYFGNGASTYTPGTATDTILGFTGSLTATGGANGTLFFTGTAGNNVVSTGAGKTTIVGFGANDLLTATGSSSDVLTATGTASTVNGAQSSGNNSYFAFGANSVVIGGSGQTAIESAIGNATLTAGSGSTLFELLAGVPNRQVAIGGFVAGQDFVQLQGYAAGAGAAALPTAVFSSGNEMITLADGSQITFLGMSNLTTAAFV